MLAEDQETGQKCALKLMNNQGSKGSKQIKKFYDAEVSSLKECDHPNICKLYDHSDKEYVINSYGRKIEVSFIAMEYAENGELFDFIAQTEKFNEKEVRYYFHQMIETLEYLHTKGLAHRDIKPENLLLDGNFQIKVGDFGFATKECSSLTRRGTIGYMAPEVLANLEYDPKQADLFSAGVILFIMLTQHCPFVKADKDDKYYKRIARNEFEEFWRLHSRNSDSETFSDSFKDLFCKMITCIPEYRLSIEEIKAHEWYNGPVATSDEIFQAFTKRKEQQILKKIGEMDNSDRKKNVRKKDTRKPDSTGKTRSSEMITTAPVKLKTKFFEAEHGDILVDKVVQFCERLNYQYEKSTEYFKVTLFASNAEQNVMIEANICKKKNDNVRRIE